MSKTENPKIKYHDNGEVRRIEYRDENGRCHRDDGPAALWFYANGKPCIRIHYKHGKYHNEKGYAYEEWDEGGSVDRQEYWLNDQKVDSLPGVCPTCGREK